MVEEEYTVQVMLVCCLAWSCLGDLLPPAAAGCDLVLCLKESHDTITKSSRTEQKLFQRTGGRFSGDEGEEDERAAAAAQQEDCCSILVLGWIDG